jgi:hypothetical protein
MELMRLHEGLNLDIPRLRDRYSSANLKAGQNCDTTGIFNSSCMAIELPLQVVVRIFLLHHPQRKQ